MRPALASPAVEAYAQQQAPASETPTAGCTMDTDCKGDRICERGACVTPH